MHVIIVGGGRVGKSLAYLLIHEKHDVVMIEKKLNRAKDLSAALDALVLNGDATEEEILIDAGIKRTDCLVTATGDDKVNLLVAEKAKKFEVKKIISRVCDPENYEFFLKLEVIPINVTADIVSTIHNAIAAPERNILLSLVGGEAYIMRLLVKEPSHSIGKKLGTVEFRENIIALERSKRLIPLDKNEVLLEGDIVYALAKPEELKGIAKTFTGSSE